jgi:hypothetical protein
MMPSPATQLVSGTASEKVSFGNYLRKYAAGQLQPSARKRKRAHRHQDIRDSLVHYLRRRRQLEGLELDSTKPLRLEWTLLKAQLEKWALQCGKLKSKTFQSQPTFVLRLCKDLLLPPIDLIQPNNIAVRGAVIAEWKGFLRSKIAQGSVRPSSIYSVDLSWLFYHKLPSLAWVEPEEPPEQNGEDPTEPRRSRDRVGLLVCTAANGQRVPLAAVARTDAHADAVRLLDGDALPIPCHGQSHAWVTLESFEWWIWEVFWPHHTAQNGATTSSILLLDEAYLPVGQLNNAYLPKNLNVICVPQDLDASFREALLPSRFGIVQSLQGAYATEMLRKIRQLYGVPGGWVADNSTGSGLDFGQEAHLLDALRLLSKVWSEPSSTNTSDTATSTAVSMPTILDAWKQTDILPPNVRATQNKKLAKHPAPATVGGIPAHTHEQLTVLMAELTGLMQNKVPASLVPLQGSFAEEQISAPEILHDLVKAWINNIESLRDIHEGVVDDELNEIKITEQEKKVGTGSILGVAPATPLPMTPRTMDPTTAIANCNLTFLDALGMLGKLRHFAVENQGCLDTINKLEVKLREREIAKTQKYLAQISGVSGDGSTRI